jgi:hypothetical protein
MPYLQLAYLVRYPADLVAVEVELLEALQTPYLLGDFGDLVE